jgi:tRNA modification GTPase
VERSRKVLKEADLILYVLNYSEVLTEEDERLFEAVRDMDYIVVINKTDLPQKIDLDYVQQLAGDKLLVTTSLIEEEGIDQLEEAIAELFFEGQIEAGDMTYVSNARHIALLHQAHQTISDAIEAADLDVPVDMIQIDVTRTWEILGEIIGDTADDGLLNQLFSQFCLGK